VLITKVEIRAARGRYKLLGASVKKNKDINHGKFDRQTNQNKMGRY